MPGPQAKNRTKGRSSTGRNRKTAAALESRIKAYEEVPRKDDLSGQGLLLHKPGSQNRKKGLGGGSRIR